MLVSTTTTYKNTDPIAETFYDIKYWTSIITSNVSQISKLVSQKNHFGILIYILSWKHLFEIYFRLLRRNNKLKTTIFWQTFDVIIDVSLIVVVKGLR